MKGKRRPLLGLFDMARKESNLEPGEEREGGFLKQER